MCVGMACMACMQVHTYHSPPALRVADRRSGRRLSMVRSYVCVRGIYRINRWEPATPAHAVSEHSYPPRVQYRSILLTRIKVPAGELSFSPSLLVVCFPKLLFTKLRRNPWHVCIRLPKARFRLAAGSHGPEECKRNPRRRAMPYHPTPPHPIGRDQSYCLLT